MASTGGEGREYWEEEEELSAQRWEAQLVGQGHTGRQQQATLNTSLRNGARGREMAEDSESGGSSAKGRDLTVNLSRGPNDPPIRISEHLGELMKPHQLDGVRFMFENIVVCDKDTGCLLAHEMGLGKTLQVIALMMTIAEANSSDNAGVRRQIPARLRRLSAVIVCPPGLVANWEAEISKWVPNGMLGRVCTRTTRGGVETWAKEGGVIIKGMQAFKDMARPEKDVIKTAATLVVCDEAQTIKNEKTGMWKAMTEFETKNRIALTGTPLSRDAMDVQCVMNWAVPNLLPEGKVFKKEYGNPIRLGLFEESTGSAKLLAQQQVRQLQAIIGPKLHRCGISVISHEMPNKKEFLILMPISPLQKALYEAYLDWQKGEKTGGLGPFELVTNLRPLLAHPRVFRGTKAGGKPAFTTIMESEIPSTLNDEMASNKVRVLIHIVEASRRLGEKVLLFSQSIPTLDFLGTVLGKREIGYQRLDGKTSPNNRQQLIKDFNEGRSGDVFLISTMAGGTGHNIQAASRVVIFDSGYTPAQEQQAIARAYRMGQQKDVYVYWLVTGGTFDEGLQQLRVGKEHLASRILDGKTPRPTASQYASLMQPLSPTPYCDYEEMKGKDTIIDSMIECAALKTAIANILPTEIFHVEEECKETRDVIRKVVPLPPKEIRQRAAERTVERGKRAHEDESDLELEDLTGRPNRRVHKRRRKEEQGLSAENPIEIDI
ncbi:P-loop containing nucleoside triphosphate hydrolase protein [Apiosordaria backusii]|nr:P-loop containing nucleoside triphosphate hydrolase protein [Apiosordaria backusii]